MKKYNSDVVPTPPYNKGFTLAEVLITLVIIGVIAAITVPTLITKYQKEQTVTRLKKVYSVLSQTTQKAIADNGPISTWEFSDNVSFAKKYLIPYLNISKYCGTDNSGPCNFNKFYLNGEADNSMTSYPKFILSDGTLVGVQISKTAAVYKVKLAVDINGPKKPNKNGKDVFGFFYFLKEDDHPEVIGKFMPDGQERTLEELINNTEDHAYACKNGKRGTFCTALIMKQNWQITDDYPW